MYNNSGKTTEKAFGFEIKSTVKKNKNKTSPVELNSEFSMPIGNAFTTNHLVDYRYKTESELICTYRDIAMHSEIANAIDEIVNEAFIFDGSRSPVSLNLTELNLPKKLNNMISDEFYTILRLLKFRDNAYEIFRRWYIDGRIYFNIIVDENNAKNGILEIRYIDPLQIQLVKEPVAKRSKDGHATYSYDDVNEYYEYKPFGNIKGDVAKTESIKLAKDSVVYVTTGEYDRARGVCVSHLDKAIKPLNNLRSLEDSLVILRLSRSSLKRAFYIDVSDMSKAKAEQHMQMTMSRFRNKVDYDPNTGLVRDSRKFQAMQEDYWLPRREGKNTEIITLDETANLGEVDDIVYMRNLLYTTLNVPVSRFTEDAGFMWGQQAEITRDEIKFSKFVKRLTHKFSSLFRQLMRIQLSLKGIVTISDWERMSEDISYDYEQELLYHEMQLLQVTSERMNTLQEMDEFIGTYYSRAWVKRNILGQDEQEIKEMQKEIEAERKEDEENGLLDNDDEDDFDDEGDNDRFGASPDKDDKDNNKDDDEEDKKDDDGQDQTNDFFSTPKKDDDDEKDDDQKEEDDELGDKLITSGSHKYTMKTYNKESILSEMDEYSNGK